MNSLNIQQENNNIFEENIKSELLEEEYINNLLADVTLKKPYNNFDIFLKEKFNNQNSINVNNDIIDNNNNTPEGDNKIFKIKKYKNIWNALSDKEKEEYKEQFLRLNNKYKKEVELVKKYIFKGVDGKLKIKSTAYQIYLNDKLIEGLEKNFDPEIIKKQARVEWKNISIENKKNYILRKKENDTILDLVLKYKNINPFILYVFNILNICKKNKNAPPNMKKLVKDWENLNNSEKNKYEIYIKNLKYDIYNIRHIYESVYGIMPKTPSGALRLFLQEKAKKKEINNIPEGIKLWEKLDINEKEKYLKLSHKYYLAYKYKELLYKKKIKRIYPNKPFGPFQFYLNEKRGIKLSSGVNPIIYWRSQFNKLNDKQKEKYVKLYNESIIIYNKKLQNFNNKIFDLPKPPKNAFSFYITDEFNEVYKKKSDNFNLKEYFELLSKNWKENKVNKNKYEKMAYNDMNRYKNQIILFEKFGFYYKNNNYFDYDEGVDEKYETVPKIKKKRLSNDKDTVSNKKNKKCLTPNNNTSNNNIDSNNLKKAKLQYIKK